MLQKEIYVGYVVVQLPSQELKIVETACTYDTKISALDAADYMRVILEDTDCVIISKNVKKIKLTWQKKSH